jgi:hypothetical protein
MLQWICIFSVLACNHLATELYPKPVDDSNPTEFSILFYNTENLYDIFDDSLTNDDDFLPKGKMYWTKKKYDRKLNNLSKVLLSSGIEPPAIIGLAEIENKKVLYDLCRNTPLEKFDYKIIHSNSPDKRGIDVGFLYQGSLFKPISNESIRINFDSDSTRTTRDIIYVKGIIAYTDTLHLFFNHWPSRRGGEIESQESRAFVANKLRHKVDSLFSINHKSNIIIMGDFNDEPDNESVLNVLRAQTLINKPETKQLYNLSSHWLKNIVNIGTHKFKGKWAILDQIIVSSNVLEPKSKGISCFTSSAFIVNEQFLFEEDRVYGGAKPFRTYSGFKYTGGFSDHLPIVLKVFLNKY